MGLLIEIDLIDSERSDLTQANHELADQSGGAKPCEFNPKIVFWTNVGKIVLIYF